MAKNNDDNNELPNKYTAKLNKSMNNKDKTKKKSLERIRKKKLQTTSEAQKCYQQVRI